MKNKHIKNLLEVVPVEYRIDVYQKALVALETSHIPCKNSGFGLCLILPVILWELTSVMDEAPDNNPWYWETTGIAFPELTHEVIAEIDAVRNEGKATLKRIEILKRFLEELK